MSITESEYEEVRAILQTKISEDLLRRVDALIKPKRKNMSRAPFNNAVLEHLRVNDDISVADMKEMPAYTDARPTRNAALKGAEKLLDIKLEKTGKYTWRKVADNAYHYDNIAKQIEKAPADKGYNIRNDLNTHNLSEKEAKKALQDRGFREFTPYVWGVA